MPYLIPPFHLPVLASTSCFPPDAMNAMDTRWCIDFGSPVRQDRDKTAATGKQKAPAITLMLPISGGDDASLWIELQVPSEQ